MGRFRRGRRETALERDLRRAAEELEHAGPWALPATAEQRIRAEIAMRLGISRDRLDQAYTRAGERQTDTEREAG